ncbi:hypothetical protein GCM10014719_57100 [Planomonospora parontospora subsp. antibiotica]|nr:hypothetical protein GCM10014719_57100 [Planomonospora parontospora subsp. antibiotica]GII18747.1 hypothetical protein Ppa05_54730 [Planomonospora parontospora subsp. antibiotica]
MGNVTGHEENRATPDASVTASLPFQRPPADPVRAAFFARQVAEKLTAVEARHGMGTVLQTAARAGIDARAVTGLLSSTLPLNLSTVRSLEVALAVRLMPDGSREPFRPYSAEDVAALYRWAEAQPPPLRASCRMLLTLGIGCGLHEDELFWVRVADVRLASSRTVAVAIPGPRERVIACREPWEHILRAEVTSLPGQVTPLFSPQAEAPEVRPAADSAAEAIAAFVASTTPSAEGPELCPARLHDTWLQGFTGSGIEPSLIAACAGYGSVFDLPAVLRPGCIEPGEMLSAGDRDQEAAMSAGEST